MTDVGGARPFDQQSTRAKSALRHGSDVGGPALAAPIPNWRHDWTINGDFLALRPTGVARYAREVTLALDALMTEGHPMTRGLQFSIVAPCEPPGDLPLKSIPVRVVPEYSRPRLPQFWVQAQLPFYVRGGLLSFCNLAPLAIRRQIVCIHDLHTRLMPQSYGRGFRLAHRLILPALGRRASAITTVSSFSRDHIAGFGVAPFEKITVTYNGSDHVARWDATLSSIDLGQRPFVFCLGQSQKYKNVELLLKLAPALDRLGLDLCMAGDFDAALLKRLVSQQPSNLRLLGRISDNDLAKALSHALCFLFPSRIEGFGLPAVEAMALGCPLVASTAPCLPEVCGDAALYAGPADAGSWISAVRRLCNEDSLRRHLAEKGRARAATFSWRRIAEAYLLLIADIDFC
ncbi:glycosyltransferase family 1 protein [Sinorhizobium meliloti]|uniref:glycosyltransferase family 4 protein n=1 Tax=Rhizobium meliloti TaxID=382 RepID=UPI00031CD7F2|nr:glycosyltransferase family 1 protein [Sinorhizobium meliloti]MDE4603928.1 glycosyltransferase family 4 protein [Sinorhizobium meliloti]MDX0371225.1 glycosyltransferase [Sinorhizobium meliloti]MQU96900.1 glycosyltransferase [Sinorhizobium meliloti]RVH10609.1 glycosyltransferase family 1 protein [Sinorhizobium meliloti]RVP15466.1 glycosyltransferase family 1 protein [Sinorhizobium meliloti]